MATNASKNSPTSPLPPPLPVPRSRGGFHTHPLSSYQAALLAEWPWRGSAAPAAASGDPYALFQEMEDKDAHLFAALQTRRAALLGVPWKVVPADGSEAARNVARLVERTLLAIPGWNESVGHLLDSFAKGFAVAEVVWGRDPATGEARVASIRPRWPGDFAFDAEGNAWVLTHEDRESLGGPEAASKAALLPRPGEAFAPPPPGFAARPVPPRKLLHLAFQPGPAATGASPYGTALCAKVYWLCWLKRGNLRQWASFNERFGAPTPLARYGPEATPEEIARLRDVLESIQSDAGVLLPEGIALEFLEARRGSSGGGTSPFRELADWANDEISKAVLGQTLTSGEGRRSGSLALGAVHERVRGDYLAADARWLGEALTSQLVRWIVDFAAGPDSPAPSLVLDCGEDAATLRDQVAIDRELLHMGVALPESYFHARYRRPAPAEGEAALRYDDRNLYQYHLQYGVLTVNEVRTSLGLAPVAWGEVRAGGLAGVGRPGTGTDNTAPPSDADLTEQALEQDTEARTERRRR